MIGTQWKTSAVCMPELQSKVHRYVSLADL